MREKHAETLLQSFERHRIEDWKKVAEAELKGDNPEKRLTVKTPDGFELPALSDRENTVRTPSSATLPGEPPFLRGAKKIGERKDWAVRKMVRNGDAGFIGMLESCASAPAPQEAELIFRTGGRAGSVAAMPGTLAEAMRAAEAAKLPLPSLFLNAGEASVALLALLHSAEIAQFGGLTFDPFAVWLEAGRLHPEPRAVFDLLCDLARRAEEWKSPLRVFTAGGDSYHNAGAPPSVELACVMAAAIAYLRAARERGLRASECCRRLQLSFPIGTSFFAEAAKLRAARLLWSGIASRFGATAEEASAVHVHAGASVWSMTSYDRHVNMLRGTVETLAAALGGADSISTRPFDETLLEQSALAARMAVNTSLILKHESMIGRVADPLGGSYTLENMTRETARRAWEVLKDIERDGGFPDALRSGNLQAMILEANESRRDAVARRREVFIGANQYPNMAENLSGDTDERIDGDSAREEVPNYADPMPVELAEAMAQLEACCRKGMAGATLAMERVFKLGGGMVDVLRALYPEEDAAEKIKPIRAERGPEPFERLRSAVERTGRRPKVWLAQYGPPVWRRARAAFSSGFFGTAGFEIVDGGSFDTPEEAFGAALDSCAEIVVACSDDESYPGTVPLLAREAVKRKHKPLIIVAGFPKDAVDELKRAGVFDFIHVKADALAVLKSAVEALVPVERKEANHEA